MIEESWRPVCVPGFEERYDVSDLGRVRGWWLRGARRAVPHVMNPNPDKYGHLYVNLINGEYPRTRPLRKSVHQLVAGAFNGPRPDGLETRHLDGDRLNNTPENLAYGTRSENVRDGIAHGTNNSWGWKNRKKTA